MFFKDKKIDLIKIILMYLFLVSVLSLGTYKIFINNFEVLEENKNSQNVNTLLSKISSELERIENITTDYAHWDDTYDFILTDNRKYVHNNFRKGTKTLDDLNLDFMIFTNLNNKILFSKYKDNKIKNTINTQVLQQTLNIKEVSSIVKTKSALFYLVKSKVLKSDAIGNGIGYLYVGKFINNNILNSYNKSFKNIEISTLEMQKKIEKREFESLHKVGIDSYIKNYEYRTTLDFYDSLDQYIFTIKTINTIDIIAKGKETIVIYNFIIAILILLMFIYVMKAERELVKNNTTLELESSIRKEKLDKYLRIVNKYVTTSSTDLHGTITHVSEAFCRISGYSKEELIGKSHRIVKNDSMNPAVYKELWETISSGKKWVGEIENKKKNGDTYWVLANIEPTYDYQGKKVGYTSIRQEITDKKRIEKLSVTDKLTQLYNRVKIEEIFDIEIAKYHRYNTSFFMILIDIDFFKDVNDTYGHNVGDTLLQEISAVLKSSVRKEDVVGRWGGEEFIILANNNSIQGVLSLAEKIRKNIESYNFTTVGKKTASFGVAILNKEDTQESIIARADKSLYHAKKTGRNKVCLH